MMGEGQWSSYSHLARVDCRLRRARKPVQKASLAYRHCAKSARINDRDSPRTIFPRRSKGLLEGRTSDSQEKLFQIRREMAVDTQTPGLLTWMQTQAMPSSDRLDSKSRRVSRRPELSRLFHVAGEMAMPPKSGAPKYKAYFLALFLGYQH